MDVSVVDHSDILKEIIVTLSQEELKPHFENAYKREQAKVEIKGFRKGKAPLDMVKKLYGEAIQYEALDDIANDVFRNILIEKDISPLGEPSLTDMKFKIGEPLTFNVKFEVQPKVELKEYKGISVDKLVHQVTDEDVENEILHIQKSNSVLSEVQSANDDEHIITIDIQELDDTGSPLIGRKGSGTRVYLADEQNVPEVRYALQNVSLNDKRKVTFEIEHENHKHLNNWEMTVTKIEKVTIPELNDDFVKKATRLKVSTVAEFRENVRKDLERYWAETSESRMKDMLIGEIVRRHEFDVPDAMVKGLTDARIEEFKKQAPGQQLPKEFDEKTFREQYRPVAIFQAKWYLIRDRIIAQEHLEVTDAEIEKQAELDAPKMSIEKERLLTFYKSSESFKDRIIYDKLMNFLISTANVVEKEYQPEEEEEAHS